MSTDRTLPQSDEELKRAQQESLRQRSPPTHVPGYEPEKFLGAGAYGEVWVALDRNTGRRVAIKFYAHRGGMDWSLLSREVEKLAYLSADRYVVQLFDVGWQANPPYYVMEYLERGSLEDRLQAGPMPVSEAVALFHDVAVGLVHSHGKGVLHCDLKPANVLLDQDLKPRLADFGQSRLSHEQTPALGTLFYMAPEQAALDAVPDARWDVYALGALLYCMLTGSPPHRSEELSKQIEAADTLEERLLRYRRAIETSPRLAAHRRVPGIDRPLVEIVDRCLTPDPERRFANVQSVLDALDERAKERARRPMLILGGLGPLILFLVMSYYAWTTIRTVVEDTDAQLTERALETNHFAASFVAETVARQIDRRWVILEQAAADPEFHQLLANLDELPPLVPGQSEPERQEAMKPWFLSLGRQNLQGWLSDLAGRHDDQRAASWFFSNVEGRQVLRIEENPFNIGRSFAHRDYFHGKGKDELPGTPGLTPTATPHRSIVFASSTTNNRVVAFSVPVWSQPVEGEQPRVIGVLAMTVELGNFAELRTPSGVEQDQVAVLVDLRPDEENLAGSILEHPHLPELLQTAAAREPDFPWPRIDAQRLALLERLRHSAVRENGTTAGDADSASLLPDYRDPIGGGYSGRWLAACEPVILRGRSEEVRDSGWVVIVQQRYDAATAPVRELGDTLTRQGLVALGVVLAVVTALWGFVILALTESSLGRLANTLRRTFGLPTASLGTAKNGRDKQK